MITDAIIREYKKYECAKQLEEKFVNLGHSSMQRYEAFIILERWLMTNINDTGSQFVSLRETDQQLMKELAQKKIITNHAVITKFMKDVKKIIDDATNEERDVKLEPKLEIDGGIIKFNNCEMHTTPERIQILLNLADKNALAYVTVRYAAILPKSKHYTIPIHIYQALVNLGYNTEGFTTPFNAQILRCGKYKFCSMFKDSDEVYGSLGDFFKADLAGLKVILNPPRINILIERAANYCLETLAREPNTLFFFHAPGWADAAFHKILKNSQYLRYFRELIPFEYYIEDVYQQNLLASFKTFVYVLHGVDVNKKDYDNILKYDLSKINIDPRIKTDLKF